MRGDLLVMIPQNTDTLPHVQHMDERRLPGNDPTKHRYLVTQLIDETRLHGKDPTKHRYLVTPTTYG